MWSALLATLAVVGIVVGIVLLLRGVDRRPPAPRREAWETAATDLGTRIVLDLEVPDPSHPSVERLATDAAHRTLARDQTLTHVEVVDRSGQQLGRVERPEPLTATPGLPAQLREPHTAHPHVPSPVRRSEPEGPTGPRELAPEVRRAPLADRLDLPAAVRAEVQAPDRAVDIVRAILTAAGRDVTMEGDLVRTGDVAIAVVDPRPDADQALTHGFLRIQATDAARGIVLRLGYADPAVVRRRELAAPHVRHVGPDALQRMADAVAAGADPITFAAGPATV